MPPPPTIARLATSAELQPSVGDSVAAGEGNPGPKGTWRDPGGQCHRSPVAAPRVAALEFEWSDPQTSVTFVTLACTGARIQRTQGEAQPIPGKVLLDPSPAAKSQFQQADEFLPPGRKADAILISVGANDIRFSKVLTFCLASSLFRIPPCFDLPYRGAASLDLLVRQRIADLPPSYDALANRIARDPVAGNAPVFITEYFDPMHGANAQPCRIDGILRKTVAAWAYDRLLDLNDQVRQAAQQHGWTYVGNIATRFLRHGYCAGRDSWVHQIIGGLFRKGGL
ncbi:MAG: hypothetical protein E6G40_10590, partial [Actinobacteria bacterium]